MNVKMWQQGALAMMWALAIPAAQSAVITTVLPIADGYVRSGAEKKNLAFETHIELKTTLLGGTSEGYLLFPLPQETTFAEKIVLRFFAQLSDAGTAKVLARSVTHTNWNELGLTWRTRPPHKETVGTLTIVGLSGAWYELDVTAFAKTEAAEGKTALALALVPGDDSRNTINIRSRENLSEKPSLTFSRELISARISFCPRYATPPTGYLGDHGDVFGPRTNGFTYGWNIDTTEYVRDRAESKYKKDKPVKTTDRRYDFLAYMDNEKMKSPPSWEIAVPNGAYNVHIAAGDSTKYDSIFGITAEGATVIDGLPDAQHRWLESTVRVNVVDGRLTIAGSPSSSNNKISFIEINEVENLFSQTK